MIAAPVRIFSETTTVQKAASDGSGPVSLPSRGTFTVVIAQATNSGAAALPDHLMLGSLQDSGVRLIADIPLEIAVDGGSVVVSWVNALEFGYGDTLGDAIIDFRRVVVDLFLSLQSRTESIGDDLKGVLAVLQSHMVIAPE